MAKKDNSWLLLVILGLAVFFIYKGGFGFLNFTILPTANYNGEFEEWCIRAPTDVGTGYGFYDPGTGVTSTRCTAANGFFYLNPTYDGINNQNEAPTMMSETYGCCYKKTTDAHSGQYALQYHKQNTDDWFFFGQGKTFGQPAVAGKVYTWAGWYKLTKSASDVRFSIIMNFLDANDNDIVSGRQSFEFPAAATYTRFNLSTTAPPGTVKTYWRVQVNQYAMGDLFLDDITLDETGCVPGSTLNCGIDTGACSYGTQTCDSNQIWGACIGAVGPTIETCGDTIDNDCDGPTDEGCTFTPYTRDQYIAKFDEIDSMTYNHTAFSTKSFPTWWAWDNSPIVESQLNMYKATGATKYLDYVVANSDLLISKAGDGNGDGLKDWQNLENPIDPILTYSRNLLPMIKFAYIVKKDGLTQYYAKADSYIAFVETNFIPVYDQRWRECGTIGFWDDGGSAPNNRASFVARTHLYLYLITGQTKYFDRSTKYANKLKSTLLTRTDGPTSAPYYFWNYANRAGCTTVGNAYSCSVSCPEETRNICNTNSGDWVCSGPLELSYGNYDILGMVNYYQAGIVFTNSDLVKLQNTFKEGFLVEQAEVEGVPNPVLRWNANPGGPPENAGYYGLTAGAHHWAILGQYDNSIKLIFDKINKNILEDALTEANSYYNHAYVCVTDMRDPTLTNYCIPSSDPQWDGDYRSTPAYQLSRIGWQLTGPETLTVLGTSTGPICGDGQLTGTSEVCDGSNLNGKSCQSFGFTSGALSCASNCQSFVTTSCVNNTTPAPQCGNNQIESGEVCDGTALGSQTCAGLGYSSGSLSCNSGCTGYVTSSCQNAQTGVCGNGIIDTGELCDLGNLGGITCQNLGYTGGALSCGSNCYNYLTAGCILPAQCTSYWECSAYGACTNGQQSRTCSDINRCSPSNSPPQLTTSCSTTDAPSSTTNSPWTQYIVTAVIVAALGGGAAYLKFH